MVVRWGIHAGCHRSSATGNTIFLPITQPWLGMGLAFDDGSAHVLL